MKTGVTLNSIFPIRNFCSEMSPTPGPGVLILSMLKVALDAASDYLRGQVQCMYYADTLKGVLSVRLNSCIHYLVQAVTVLFAMGSFDFVEGCILTLDSNHLQGGPTGQEN